ncbi:tripeptide aminopeptidase [Pilibacter termitis]|uniref:Peptidase T n=1 Tax=Pilibacter termitis TaxID=263852 RepID=A0A1T4NL28_9ENTE|nr:peptidase T [Pilibacter termitis]SJZ79980.1 tripeptide aminopeptidase [Pilibacter termitis]
MNQREEYKNLLPRFLKYVKEETRSNPESTTTPSTQSQVDFTKNILIPEMEEIGLTNVHYLESNGYAIGTLPATKGYENARKIGFIAHVDTADFNAVGINPQIIENYDGKSDISLGTSEWKLTTTDFPNLLNYKGDDLITTDGTTLLGSDDKSGIAEIMTAMEFLIAHPEIPHGEIRVGFGPDEEIGVGADKFDVEDFDVDFAYTVDGGPLGELQYETFSAAAADITIQGKNVHPGTAKNTMINALQVAIDFHNHLPSDEVPEKTDGYQGFSHLYKMTGTPEEAQMQYIIRDFEKEDFLNRKNSFIQIANKMNEKFGQERVKLVLKDQYYNMKEVIERDMEVVNLANQAMIAAGVSPVLSAIRGGTDGSKISFMGIPTPNIFAGGENMHGRFEFVSLQTMEKAVDVIVKIVELNVRGSV